MEAQADDGGNQGEEYSVEWSDEAMDYVKGIFALNKRRPEIEAALAKDPFPKDDPTLKGKDLIVKHLDMDPLTCSYRWREGEHRLLYDIDPLSKGIYIYDANLRSVVYRGWW